MSEHRAPPPHTGQADVDAVLHDLVDVFDRPVGDQVRAVDDAHARLREALDGGPGEVARPEQPGSTDRPGSGG